MLTFIILASIAIVALLVGFFDIRIPFVNGSIVGKTKAEKKIVNDPVKSIEGFYRTLRVESWINNIQLRSASEVEVA